MLVTDNAYFLKGSNKDHPIITYDKNPAKPSKITTPAIIDAICKGFGTQVGSFSNAATCLYAMAAMYPEGDPRRDELLRRIKLEREIVGQEIDRIKGAAKPYLPTAWKETQKVPEGASQDEARAIHRANSLAITRKPRFMRHLYPELDGLARQFDEAYDRVSRDAFGIPYRDLARRPRAERTKDQDDLVRRHERFSPLIESDCAMNRVCRAVEAAERDVKWAKPAPGTLLPRFPGEVDPAKLAAMASAYKDYKSRRQAALVSLAAAKAGMPKEAVAEATKVAMDELMESIRESVRDAGVTPEEALRACHEIAKGRKSFDWSFAWDLLDASVVPLIPQGRTVAPVEDPNGDVEYLGRRFSQIDATDGGEIAIDNLLRAVLGPYDWGPEGAPWDPFPEEVMEDE